MKRTAFRPTALILLPLLTGSAALFATAAPARAAELCGNVDPVVVGSYLVQNNPWNAPGDPKDQCVSTTGDGFEVTKAEGEQPTTGGPKGYPSIYNGCHYDKCSPGTSLPVRIDSISSAPTTASFTYPAVGAYNAAYDIWLDPEPRKTGQHAVEIMVWANKVGSMQPIGAPAGTTTLAGHTWEVWQGTNGTSKVISYVAPSALTTVGFDVKEFIGDACVRGFGEPSWYLTSVQAGFEPWQGGAGLKIDSFASKVDVR
ncbi:GH12 family glycosyl hydrolase domain-containing protein [Streptomyces cucumeris]|uniref:GH12 family glycosyl hydrolase domain-containing protein n=1 Tax=Streptomyces cucumeris TaxID=2962890 RepID=UPI003D74DE59